MKKWSGILALLLFLGFGAKAQAPQGSGWVPLFNGKDLTGWKKNGEAVQTHCGFIPENPNDLVYKEAIAAMKEVAGYCKSNGQNFHYETGQETPITLVRAIQDVGLDNQGVNFDLANLILYGKANPVDAIELLGPYVQGIHAKGGLFPANPKDLGKEVPIGKGKVDFPYIIERSRQLN